MTECSVLLTQGQLAVVDSGDYDNVVQYRWYFHSKGYAARDIRVGSHRTTILLHQHLMGYREGYTVDHVNRNRLDCRRENLRWATPSQQEANKPIRRGSSKYRGVYWHKPTGKWRAYTTFDRRRRYIGFFEVEDDAAKAYDKEALKWFGPEFAILNFPNG